MNLIETVPYLLDGKTLRSKSDATTIRMAGVGAIVSIMYFAGEEPRKEAGASPYQIGLDSLTADDWEVLEDTRTEIEKARDECSRYGIIITESEIKQVFEICMKHKLKL